MRLAGIISDLKERSISNVTNENDTYFGVDCHKDLSNEWSLTFAHIQQYDNHEVSNSWTLRDFNPKRATVDGIQAKYPLDAMESIIIQKQNSALWNISLYDGNVIRFEQEVLPEGGTMFYIVAPVMGWLQ